METAKSKSPGLKTQSPEHVLELYYSQFLKWGSILTRGDEAIAREIVHDLCLHFALAKPDLRQVENLDGYLYTCLRHIYLSTLARASRDAAQLISIAEYDSIYFALRSGSPDGLLQRQNDLRRICSYATWRKESAKSASYLTLLFFHGYTRAEIAAIACVPLAAIYNKLKIAREELKDHLANAKTLRIVRRDVPPDPELRVTPVPFAELFDELRSRILSAKTTECLTEDGLLEHYRTATPKPISCSLLAHIVSCERCLALLDRHFGRPMLADHEPPVDTGDGASGRHLGGDGYRALMRSVRWHRDQIYEHRPGRLFIAINGKITASHDVQGERSTLCSRIENPPNAHFVEVFSEQQIRLALLPVGEPPPDGLHSHTQRIAMSNERWLQLTLSFDGLGLHSEVTYVDPALAGVAWDDEAGDSVLTETSSNSIPALPAWTPSIKASWPVQIGMILRTMMRRPVMAWSVVVLAVLTIGGLSAYRWLASSSNPSELLGKSMRGEAADLNGQAEHQVLRVEEAAANGKALFNGTVDAWKDSTGRRMRRLYDGDKHLLAAEWQTAEGNSGSYSASESEGLPYQERVFAASSLWRVDVSATAFRAIAGGGLTMHEVDGNYEITSPAPSSEMHLSSATLVLNGRLHTVGEILRVQVGSSQNIVRLVQTDYERRPMKSAPAGVFDPSDLEPRSRLEPLFPLSSGSPERLSSAASIHLVQLHIAVLAQLNELTADVGEPIEVKRTSDGRIRISGTVQDQALKRQIIAALDTLADRRLLDVSLLSPQEIRDHQMPGHMRTFESTSVYDFESYQAPADALIRMHFSQMGMPSDQVNTLAARFSRDTLESAQRALQEAYALDRLGNQFSTNELREIDAASQHQWAAMAAMHASALNRELRDLRQQLDQLAPDGAPDSSSDEFSGQFQNPGEFGHDVHGLLRQIQLLNKRIGLAFASGSGKAPNVDSASFIGETSRSIPLHEATTLNAFTARLAGDGTNRALTAKPTPRRQAPQ